MAHYEITHRCGHTTRHNLTGPHSSRAWREQQLAKEDCQDCWQQARDAANAEENRASAERAAAAGWPAFVAGTEKQRAWAESVRAQVLARLDTAYAEIIRRAEEGPQAQATTTAGTPPTPAQLTALFTAGRDLLLSDHLDANWWITHRDESDHELLRMIAELGLTVYPDLDPRRAAREAAAAETTATPPAPPAPPRAPELPVLRPAGAPQTETIAVVTAAPLADGVTHRLRVLFPEKREEFRLRMRALDFTWLSGAWERTLPATAEDVADRLAEVACALVAAGFVVRLRDAEAHARAVAGTFQPEQRHWVRRYIAAGEYAGWFALTWPRGDDFYDAAMRLLGARYRDGNLLVPPGSAEEVCEFAAAHGFAISTAAWEIITEVRESRAHGVVLSPPRKRAARVARRTAPVADRPAALPVPESVEISDELRDAD